MIDRKKVTPGGPLWWFQITETTRAKVRYEGVLPKKAGQGDYVTVDVVEAVDDLVVGEPLKVHPSRLTQKP